MQTITIVQVQQIDVSTLLSNIDGLIENRLKSFNPIPSAPNDTEEFLTREQVAKLLQVSTVTVWAWCNANILKSYKIGNKVRFKKSEVLSSPKAMNAKEGVQA